MYSPTAIDIAPAAIPAHPPVKIKSLLPAAEIPIIKEAVATKPSLAPSTAARSQPALCTLCSRLRSKTSSKLIASPYREVLPSFRKKKVETLNPTKLTQMFTLSPPIK